MSASQHVALVGLSGSGKSTLAPLVASRLGQRVVIDLDDIVAERLGMPAEQAFADLGEATFRQCESEALLEALAGAPSVIATGGGVVLSAVNRAALRADARVVWLQARPQHLASRLADTAEARPLLEGDAEFALQRLESERRALYAEVADISVDVEGIDPVTAAEDVVAALG